MLDKIHIPKPCHEDWNKMSAVEKGKFCSVCDKVVFNFSDKTLQEIKLELDKHSETKICGRYQERHTTNSSKWFAFLNQFEVLSCRLKLKRPALLLITFLLIITGCHRRLTGAYVGSYSTTEKEKRFNKNHSTSDTTQSKRNKF